MRSPRHFRRLASLTSALVLLGAALPLHADERVVYYSQPTETPGFFQRVGDFFRDMFSTEQSLSDRPTPPRPTAPRYNLDLPPPGSGYGYGANFPRHSSVSVTEQSQTAVYDKGTTAKTRPAKPHPAPTVASSETTHKPVEKYKPEAAPPKSKHYSAPVTPEYNEKDSSTEGSESIKTTSTTSKPETKSVPTGTRTGKSTRVKSPYPPYNELDVTGLPTGSLAMDPTTQKVFRVP